MIEKLKKFFRKYKDKLVARLEKSPTYKKFLKQRAKLAEWMRLKLLAFFSLMSPIYNFLCIKTLDPGQPSGNEFSQVIENLRTGQITYCYVNTDKTYVFFRRDP